MVDYSDPFTGTADPYTTNWNNGWGMGMELYTNEVYGTTTPRVAPGAWWYTGAFTDDQYTRAVLGPTLGTDDYYLVLRARSTACMKAHLYGAANVYLIYDNGTTETTITTWTWTTRSIQAGDQIEFRVEGTDYYCKNITTSEELGPYTYSSNLTSGGAAGLYIPVNAGFSFSSWSGGDVGAPASDALMGQIML